MTQCDLFRKTLDEKFQDFHAENPQVYRLFIQFANQAYEANRMRIGAKAIAERIRWNVVVETRGDSFKLNNSYVSRYARLLVQDRPYLAGLFELRKLKS